VFKILAIAVVAVVAVIVAVLIYASTKPDTFHVERSINILVFDIHMIRPFKGRNTAKISLAASGDSTNVTWSLDDKHDLKLKVVSLFVNLDKVIGTDYEVGLARLKAVAER
jgi:hypothetical protein